MNTACEYTVTTPGRLPSGLTRSSNWNFELGVYRPALVMLYGDFEFTGNFN